MITLEEYKSCLKCKHTRTAQDTGPTYACPKCGGVYAKLEAAERAKEGARADEAARRQDRIEKEAWEKANAGEIRRARAEANSHKGLAHVAYLLYVLPLGITAILGLILAYVLGAKAAGTWVESHCDWLTRTFWASLFWIFLLWAAGWMALGGTMIMAASRGGPAAAAGGMGLLMVFKVALAGLTLWYFYRIVKGWLYLFREDAIA